MRYLLLSICAAGLVATGLATDGVHLTYHWHLHQPIYWPEYAPGMNRYQFGKDSVNLKLSNTGNYYPGSSYEHPRNQLVNGDGGEYDVVFDKADRVNAYQHGGKDSIATITGHADAGVSVSYSGALQENIWSFGKDWSCGYTPSWNDGYRTARGWKTWSGASRADLVGLTYHHAFSPLLPKSVLRKEIQIFKEIWWKSWGGNPDKSDHSRGFWPVEAAFSRHMIPVLVSEGYEWAIIANSHLARTCQNYLDVAMRRTSGYNIDPPNKADVLGPYVPPNQWWSGQIDGRGGCFPAPFAYQAHRTKYVDPHTGTETYFKIVPMCDLLSYQNGFATMGTGDIDTKIAPFNNPSQPSIVVLAHDGDNAWGGGSSYYFESVPNLMNEAAAKGYHPITIHQFLQWHPPTDLVHIEDGSWVNAANDWGHPQFINWLWPPTRSSSAPAYHYNDPRTWYDFETPGWTEDWRNWAVLMAGANFCETAEQITISQGGSVQAWKIQEPTQPNGQNNFPNAAEQAWHFYLGGLDSGFMYYGTSLDDEVKQTLACNRAISLISSLVLNNLHLDQTPPTMFKPQRFPWNPGGKGWGPLTGYKPVGMDGQPPWPSDFHVWTHVFDVSGLTNVTLFVRTDHDGVNPLTSNQNETYAGGNEVGAWQAIAMTQRTVPKGNVTGNSQISFFIEPDYIADYYWAKVTGYRNVLLDYYVSATDARGNVARSDIQHVWVDDDGTVTPPPSPPQNLLATPVSTNQINLSWSASSGATSYLVKRGGTPIGTTQATGYSDLGLLANTAYCYTVAATNNAGASADSASVCTNTPATPSPGAPANLIAAALNTTTIALSWSAANDATGYIVTRIGDGNIGNTAGTVFTNTGLAQGTTYCYTVTATNATGSAVSAQACAATPTPPQPPSMPGNFVATPVATNQIDLSWSVASGATGYIIQRGGSPIAATTGISYSDSGLPASATFCYAITATNDIGTATTTNVCAATLAPPPPLGTVTNLSAVATGPNQINLSWWAATSATGYLVKRGGTAIGTTTATNYTDTGRSPGTSYCYTIVATNATGQTESAAACATTPSRVPITIGRGPALGTDRRGTTWYQEFQDWDKDDLRALDANDDQHKFNDEHDPGRDLVAFYAREEGDDYYFRVDFFDLLLSAENGHLDVYVAIDCTAGGRSWMPDALDTNTDHPWELCIKLYDTTNNDVVNANETSVKAGNWLGAYFNRELDSVEFGLKKQALLDAGWDGTNMIYFQVFTARDNTELADRSDVVDSFHTLNPNAGGGIGMLTGAIASTAATSRAKYAAIAHANQSIATRSGLQWHLDNPRPDLNLYPGLIRLLDTHEMLGVPLNMHLSGSLISGLLWARQNPGESSYPAKDGPTFLNRVKTLVDAGQGALIGGVYAEHILPYFEGEVNRASIRAFNDLAAVVFGLTPNDMPVMHVPERVIHANTNWVHRGSVLQGQPFADILAGGYQATYLDEVTHLHWWFYASETNNVGWDNNNWGRWAGGQGNDEEPYHHKLHKINGVFTFLINDREDQAKFGNDDDGMLKDTRYTLLDKARQSDASQITIVFDDWEAYAGNSFATLGDPNGNADQWHRTIRWAANHPWIEVVKLPDVLGWAQGAPTWVIDHGHVSDKTMQTYEWLKHASEHDYDHWYYGSAGNGVTEENFAARIPPTDPDGTAHGTKPYGDLNTPGTLLRDAWDNIAAMPAGNLRRLAEWAYSAMIFETAWHDENPPSWWPPFDKPWLSWADAYQSRNYQVTFQRPEANSYDDANSNDPTAGWALRLHGHARSLSVHADAAVWAQTVKNGTRWPTTVAEKKDVDDDGRDEYLLHNNKVYLCFKRWGARLVAAFVYDPATQEAIQVIGAPAANPAEEHDGEGADNNRCSGFKDRWATLPDRQARYVDMDYAATPPVQGSNYWEFVSADGQIRKRLTLPAGHDAVRGEYTLGNEVGILYLRHGLGPNQFDLLRHGDANLETASDSRYYGLRNTQGGAVFAVNGRNSQRSVGDLPHAGYQNRELPLVEQVEVYNTATNFTTWLAFSLATAQDVDGDGLSNQQEASLGTDYEQPDTDGNGMSDGFEHFYFGTPMGNDPHADPDGDGFTNWQEFLAGTAPTNPASAVRITSLTPHPDGTLMITWDCVPGKRYQVYYRDDLTSGDWALAVPDSILASTTSTNHTAIITGQTKRFYRVEVMP